MKPINKGLLRIWMILSVIWVIYAVYAYAWEPLAKLNTVCNPPEFRLFDDGRIYGRWGIPGAGATEAAQYYSNLGCSVKKYTEEKEIFSGYLGNDYDESLKKTFKDHYYKKEGIKGSVIAKYFFIVFSPPFLLPVLIYLIIVLAKWIKDGFEETTHN